MSNKIPIGEISGLYLGIEHVINCFYKELEIINQIIEFDKISKRDIKIYNKVVSHITSKLSDEISREFSKGRDKDIDRINLLSKESRKYTLLVNPEKFNND